MSKLQSIENALSAINETVFQELCDSFLILRNSNFAAFSRTGSQSGKQKTIKGTPDTFLLLPNGKYIFVEHSTNVTAGISKLENDVKKCLDTSKTGIPIEQIAEIILNVNFNLRPNEIQALRKLVSDTRTTLTIYTLDALAIELNLNHRDLAHQYLGLPLDTGQIVSIQQFINEYNNASKGITTPLDNTFLHREKELEALEETISLNNFIILTGAPGVGKTKLGIEGIKHFLSNNLSFEAYCISYKHHTLLEDLYQYFDSEKNYILFVDDANRIDAFNQITGFYKNSRKGQLKIIITVRDYAFQDIGSMCSEFSPKRIDILKLTDEQIIDIVRAEPFSILNSIYHREIVRIADGNPRLAIMTAMLSNDRQDINALMDVSDLFESYFTTFIKDDGEFAKALNIRCLGIIAFFHTVPYKDRQITTSILSNFDIDYSSFIDVIDKLDKLELAEIQFEHVKIPEQNLSTYFFYKAFVKDGLLSFETLLGKYFDTNQDRFRDCVIPANNTFGYKNVMHKLQPYLKSHWQLIQTNKDRAFKFLETFWYYLQNETLEFIFKIVEALPQPTIDKVKLTYDMKDFAYDQNQVIELLGDFFRSSNNLSDAIELAFEYTKKLPEHLPELIHKIRELLTFNRYDERYAFERQSTLYQILINGLNKNDAIITASFYELSKTFLSFKFRQTEGGRNHSIVMYEYPIPNNIIISSFRENIWNALDEKFEVHPTESFQLLQSYAEVHPDVSKEIMEKDVPYVIRIIERYLNKDSFEHCKYVQNQIRWCKRNLVSYPAFDALEQKFTNPVYEIYLKIDWDRLRDKEAYEFDDFREYEQLKEAEIRKSFVFNDVKEIRSFYEIFVCLKNTTTTAWNYTSTLDIIIDENCSKNFNLGCQILVSVIESENEIDYVPKTIFKNHLITKSKADLIWSIIQNQEFKHKGLWELSFYDYLNESLINPGYVRALISTIANMTDQNTIHFDRLQRYQAIEPELFHLLLKTIVQKNKTEKNKLLLWMDFFREHFEELGTDINLIKTAYLQQDKLQNHFDHDGKGFLKILKRDAYFLLEYVKNLYSGNISKLSPDRRDLSFVWQIEGIDEVLDDVFDFVIKREPYFGILDHFCNTFFRRIEPEIAGKAKDFLLSYCQKNFNDSNKMNVLIDIVRHSMKPYFDEILLCFLSMTQDVEIFSKIWWRGNGGTYSGNVIIGDIEAADWRNILSKVEGAQGGIKLIPIKSYINDRIESSLRSGDWERKRRFLDRY